MKTKTTFSQTYDFPGFRAKARFKCGVKGDPLARVITLERRQKKRCVRVVDGFIAVTTTAGPTGCGTWTAAGTECIWSSSTAGWIAWSAA